ncbi:MAG: single-stranded DNA-binding protein [Candidatus Yonathbacteria bacterium RIFOXYC1_FULL_52_10]|nr:MAG: single-stranded DNA-binding protein [Candidatus Yonathbacteria bacterium RIFOXYC1_FULL_52_10]
MYLNRAFVFGNLTRDPELRSLPSGAKVTSFSLATNRVWKDKNGTKQEDAEYHNVVVFGRQAETCAQYLKKGASVLVEGRMQTRTWDAQDGTKKSRTEIVADRVQFGPRGGSAPMGTEGKSTHAAPAAEEIETIEYPDEDINPDDIPF